MLTRSRTRKASRTTFARNSLSAHTEFPSPVTQLVGENTRAMRTTPPTRARVHVAAAAIPSIRIDVPM